MANIIAALILGLCLIYSAKIVAERTEKISLRVCVEPSASPTPSSAGL